MIKRTLLFATLVTASAASAAQAKECRGVSFPDQTEVNGSLLTLNGLGMRRATMPK